MKGERWIKGRIVKQRETRTQPTHIAKNEKMCLNEKTNSVTRFLLEKEYMGFRDQKHCQFELKRTEMGKNKGRLLDLLNWTGQNNRWSSGPLPQFWQAGAFCLKPWEWCCHPLGPGQQSTEPENYSQTLGSNGIFLTRFWTFLWPVTPSFFPVSFF